MGIYEIKLHKLTTNSRYLLNITVCKLIQYYALL